MNDCFKYADFSSPTPPTSPSHPAPPYLTPTTTPESKRVTPYPVICWSF